MGVGDSCADGLPSTNLIAAGSHDDTHDDMTNRFMQVGWMALGFVMRDASMVTQGEEKVRYQARGRHILL